MLCCKYIGHVKDIIINKSSFAEANLLFVESPIGVGFSYTNTSSDLTMLDDVFVGKIQSLKKCIPPLFSFSFIIFG